MGAREDAWVSGGGDKVGRATGPTFLYTKEVTRFKFQFQSFVKKKIGDLVYISHLFYSALNK